jgi:hypothetical protein
MNEWVNEKRTNQSTIHFLIANLAQLVEQLIRNEQVAGSIPAVGSESALLILNLPEKITLLLLIFRD